MSWKDVVVNLVGDMGEEGLEELLRKLDDLDEKATEPWQKTTLAMVADLLKRHGLEGLDMAKEILLTIGDNKVPDLSGLSIATASDVVAQIQNAEAAHRKLQQKYIVVVTDVLGQVLKGLIMSVT
jgi:hypothetical protein